MGFVPAIILILIAQCAAQNEPCNDSHMNCRTGGACFIDSSSCGNTCNGCDLNHVCDDKINIHCDTYCSDAPGKPATVVCCNCVADVDFWPWAWNLGFIIAMITFTSAIIIFKNYENSLIAIGIGISVGLLLATYSYTTSQFGWAAYSIVAWFEHIGYFYGSAPVGIMLSLLLSFVVRFSAIIKTNSSQCMTSQSFNVCFAISMCLGACALFGSELALGILMAVHINNLYQHNFMTNIRFMHIAWIALAIVVVTIVLTAWGCYVSYVKVIKTCGQGNEIQVVPIIIKGQEEIAINTSAAEKKQDEQDSLL